MNRKQRRGASIKDPNGNRLEPMLVRILERDALGRATTVRICHDDETLGEVAGVSNQLDMLLLWSSPKDFEPKSKGNA